ncbi:MAG TPA: hypothetical protein VMV07_20400 [Streptosporangiaceae bacterium]|nr:hypothetical protein [Streptosporangiaceae bacterium]
MPGRVLLDSLRPAPSAAGYHGTGQEKRPDMNYMLIMKNEQSGLVAIGPVSIEYQAAMLRDEIENSSGWTSVGIARILTEAQARSAIDAEQH